MFRSLDAVVDVSDGFECLAYLEGMVGMQSGFRSHLWKSLSTTLVSRM